MIVLDSNAAWNIACETEEGKALGALILDGEKIIAPYLYLYEISNTVRNQVQFKHDEMEPTLNKGKAACALIDEFVSCAEMFAEATVEGIKLSHPTYDMFYFVLARRCGATLFTLDRKLQKHCMKNGVNCVMFDKDF